MKYSFDEIKNKNYIKIGTYEEIVDLCVGTDFNDQREHLKKIIEPWLSAALQTDHLSLLLGAGFTNAVCQIAEVSSSSMGQAEFGEFSDKIDEYANKSAKEMGRGSANIEDQI